MTQDNALTKLSDMIVTERPAGKDEGELGNEGISRDDILIPRVGLAQKTSPEIDETSPKYIPDLKFMDLFHSLTKDIYGKGPLHFVILKRDDPRWMEYNRIEDGGGIKDRNVPASDPRTQFGPNGEKPQAMMFYDYIALLLTGLDPADPLKNVIAFSLKSSAIKAAKHLNMLIQQRGKKLICKGVYEVTTGSDVDKKSGATYAIYKFKNAGWLKPDSALEVLALEMFESWKDREAVIDRDDRPEADATFDPATLEREGRQADM